MNISRRIASNTVWLFAAHASNRISGFVVTILLSRYLGTEGFGAYSFVCAYVGFFIVMTDMGIDLFVTREASRDLRGSEGLVGSAILVKAVLSTLAFVLSVGTSFLIGIRETKLVLIAIASLGLLLAPFTLYTAAFAATLRLHYTAMFEIIGRALLLCTLVCVLLTGGSLTGVFVALVLPGAFVTVLNVLYARRLFRPRLAFQVSMAKNILATSITIAFGMVCTQFLLRIDQVMLEWMRGDHELGLYSAGVKCCEALNVIPIVFMASAFPLLSRTAGEGKESFSKIYRLTFKYLSLVMFPLIMILYLYPGDTLALLFGDTFRQGARAFQILCWSAIFVAMGYVVATTTISLDHQKLLVGIAVFLAGFNVVLNLVLIPRGDCFGGLNGAAIATMGSYSSSLVLLMFHHVLRPIASSFMRNSMKPLVALVPGILVVRMTSLSQASGILVSLGLYMLVVLLIKGLDRSDYEYFRTIFRRE